MPEIRFAFYVSSVRGHLVTRFGTSGRGVQSFIGASRVLGDPTELVWDDEGITALSEAEVARYRREYQRALDGGALKKRTAADYQARLDAQAKAEREAIATASPGTKQAQKGADTAASEHPLEPAAPPVQPTHSEPKA